MSSTLKSNILGTGALKQEIFDALSNTFGCKDYTGVTDPCQAQELYAEKLANAVAEGVAKGVQQYLNQSVKTKPNVSEVASGPVGHTHPLKPDDLQAP